MQLRRGFGALPAVMGILGLFSSNVPAEVPMDSSGTRVLPPSSGHRLYVTDMSLAHSVDSRVHVIDGDTFTLLGAIEFGQFGFLQPSKDGKTVYHAGSFFSRGDHGAYSEILELYDPSTLLPRSEVEIPKKRATTMNYPDHLIESSDAHYLYIQNATPASSVTVVDLLEKKVLAEIETAGCFGIYPSPRVSARFSSLCGDGAAITVSFDSTGKETGRKRSAKLFDADKDALFITGASDDRRTYFVSFLGNVHVMDMAGEVVTQEKPWSLVTGPLAADGWRPGGYQLLALHRQSGQLYIGMHPQGREGSHKDPATEIWRVDLAKRSVAARGPGAQAFYMVVTQDAHPLLYTLSPITREITKHDGATLALLGHSPQYASFEGGGPMSVN